MLNLAIEMLVSHLLMQVLSDWATDLHTALQKVRDEFRVVLVFISCKPIIESGLQYVMNRDDLLVMPRQTLAAHIPAMADRLALLHESPQSSADGPELAI